MEQEYNSGIKPWQWILTIAVIVIILILGGYMYSVRNDSTEINEEEQIGSVDQNLTGSNRLVMSDQFPGNIVYVATVELAQDGFVVIHKNNAGKPGAVIGSEYFKRGNQPGSIDLTEKTVDGASYIAELHIDDGDGVFDAAKDLPAKDANGAVVMKLFRATTDLPEDKG
jgi:hypothetical protein